MLTLSTYEATDGGAYERFLGRWTRELAGRLIDFAEFPSEGPLLDVGGGRHGGALAYSLDCRH
jgi:hypothetical protein